MQENVVHAWAMRSSRGTTTYETLLYADGSMSCDCPAWVFAKRGQDRTCKHVRALEADAKAVLARVRQGLPASPGVNGSDPVKTRMGALEL